MSAARASKANPSDGCAATTALQYLTRSTRLGEMPTTAKKVLRCHLPFQHESPHAVLLPAEAGEDEGKVYYWPRENYENH